MSLCHRLMQVEDIDSVMLIEREAYPIPWSKQVFLDSINGRHHCWVAELNGVMIGYAILSHVLDETHLLNICVAKSYSKQGYGRKLLRHVVQQAIANNSSLLFLEVRVSNEAAIKLYFSEGFNEVGLRPNYYPAQNGREDAMLMTLELSIDQYV